MMILRKSTISVFMFSLFLVLFGSVFMKANAQDYSLGSEGIKGATVPGPGLYYIMYNRYYSSDNLNDSDGNRINNGFDVKSFANVHRFVYMTDKKILGADYGMNIIIPVVYLDLDIDKAGVSKSNLKLGDINVEPMTLAWHGDRYDAALGFSAFLPTGYYKKSDPASIGGDHYTFMTTAGMTLYPDADKTWSVSLLSRYEKHFKNDDKDLTYGDDFSFDWGVGKSIGLFNVGVSGYAHKQLTKDKGSDATSDDLDHILAVGPEVQMDIPSIKGQLRVKYYKEFDAADTNEGDAFWLVLVKAF